LLGQELIVLAVAVELTLLGSSVRSWEGNVEGHVGALAHLSSQVAANEIAVLMRNLSVNDNLGNTALVSGVVRLNLALVVPIERRWVGSSVVLSNASAAKLT